MKPVEVGTLVVEGVVASDCPKFTDSFFSYGEFCDGNVMSEDELDEFAERHPDILSELAWESLR